MPRSTPFEAAPARVMPRLLVLALLVGPGPLLAQEAQRDAQNTQHDKGPVCASVCLASDTAADFTQSPQSPQQESASPTAFAAPPPKPVLQWGTGDARSYWVPAAEVPSWELLLNRFDHYVVDPGTYPSPITNFRANLHRSWVVDNDTFATNQFLHPYQGAIYQGFARSAGLDFWQASAYAFAGSLIWEESGENTAPSINDQIATGIGANFFGEPLFRMASLLLETSPNESPSWWREVAAAIISPPTGFNRLVYGNRFKPVFRSYDPAVFTRVDVGANLLTHFSSNVNVNADPSAPPAGQTLNVGKEVASLSLAYGLPGKPGYDYDRPFDYFDFQLALDTSNAVESVFSRGLLYGTDYSAGPNYRGLWGLYGIYDYVAPNIFRISNTAAGLGTTGQWWLSPAVAMQGSAVTGVGYAGGGVIHGSGVRPPGPLGDGQRNYHYGVTPEAILALRLLMGDRVALDTSARGYYISGVGATESRGSETINRVDVALTVRVFDLHGITLRYEVSHRDGRYGTIEDSQQRVSTINLGYTLLGHARFGAVDWRPGSQARSD
ncbi:MAG TPA: DUF3943 domain-containing protein [Steroidobacteraceae bacterium]|nr:DUF3943 domain-containing protein [Steroidobacteraceae bacterium]